ncbi:phospholipase A2 [Streptomyces sp. Isolate_45]|uniref:phospholipase A2 n=1 Tax=Streptomyces sp. Isolate_45 TaxID=2950111 RepID=UPI002481BE57|nr:phospholipase A2 [Streptomyces sp. Isolate_45]MDA5283693.1 phospholipase A2 [Streptomyces sp. Isolate_45]
MPTDDQPGAQRSAHTHWWQRIHGAIRMLCFVLVGVIAVGVAANADPGQSEPEPVAMGQIVAAGKSVFALAADHQAVYEWSEHQDNWRKIKGPTENLYAGGGKFYATDLGTGDIAQYDDAPYQWTRIGSAGATFAATSKHLYGLTPDRNKIMEYTGTPHVWKQVGDRAENLYTGPNKKLYVTNPDDKNIHRYDDGEWDFVGHAGAAFAVTDKNLFGLTPDRGTVVQYDSGKDKWNPIWGAAETIFASNNLYATQHGTGDLHQYTGRGPNQWKRIGGPGAAFAASEYRLYRLATDKRSVHRYDGDGTNDKWKALGAPAAGPAPTAEQKAALFASMNRLGDESRDVWTASYNGHLRGVPDPYGYRWSTNYCNFSPDIPFEEYDFRVPCARHDFLSRNYRDMYGEKAFTTNSDGQAQIDKILRDDLLQTCKNRYIGSEQLCIGTSHLYYKGVTGASAINGFNPWDLVKGLGMRPIG